MAHTHPNSIFRWEDAASLEHACWQCPTKANSPRALQTCYGTHSMPCTSYHPTMHAVGAAHRCSGCVTTREMHDARHREIAELVAEYKSLESPPPETPTRTPLLERNVNIDTAPRQERAVIQHNRDNIDENHFDVRADDEKEDEDEDDSNSLSSYTPSSASPVITTPPKSTKAELRAQKKAKKSAKSQSKALRNQARKLASVTTADVERVARILHGDESDAIHDGSAHPLATDRTIEDVINRNLKFVKNIQEHKQYLFRSVATGRKENKERKRLKKRESRGEDVGDAVEIDEVVSAIMIQLGVSAGGVSASGCASGAAAALRANSNGNVNTPGRKRTSSTLVATPSPSSLSGFPKSAVAIATKLRVAIKTDLEKHENEVHARYIRAGGFWRYVGKTVFERMTEVAAELDVGSGESWEKKRAREGRTRSESEEDRDRDHEATEGIDGEENED